MLPEFLQFVLLPFLASHFYLQAPTPAKAPSLRGLMRTAGGTAWASGSGATILRSVDDGKSWQSCPRWNEAALLDFRGIQAWDAQHAIAMSAGPGPLSRLYETVDGCVSWHLLFTNPDPDGFWDAIAFSSTDPKRGVLLGDPVGGSFTIFRTDDGGKHWRRDTDPGLAGNPAGEGAFAASNTSLTILPETADLVFGTGGLAGARIFRFDSRRKTWTSIALPLATKNESTGIFSVQFRNVREGVAVGGDYKHPQDRNGTAFVTTDGGLTWNESTVPPGGYRSAVGWDKGRNRWATVGPTGAETSVDNGRTWTYLDSGNWNALSPPLAAGSNGRVGRLPAY